MTSRPGAVWSAMIHRAAQWGCLGRQLDVNSSLQPHVCEPHGLPKTAAVDWTRSGGGRLDP